MPINTNLYQCDLIFPLSRGYDSSEMEQDYEKLTSIKNRRIQLLKDIEQIREELSQIGSELDAIHSITQDSSLTGEPKIKPETIRKRFNTDAKKGIEYAIENNILKNDPETIAQFLHDTVGLSKTQIGLYIGDRNEFNKEVLNKFVSQHDFNNINILDALRQFLWNFRIPGEAIIIQRILETFAEHYNKQNPSELTKDATYVLCYSFLILNTDLHNPNVKRAKMTMLQYKNMVEGLVDDNPSISTIMDKISNFYEIIKKEPFNLESDETEDNNMAFFDPIKEGWLFKQGGNIKTWKRRWFVLVNQCLYYFQFAADKEPKGTIPLDGDLRVRKLELSNSKNRQFCFEIYSETNGVIKACKTGSDGKQGLGKHEVYRMSAASDEERDEWIEKIEDCILKDKSFNKSISSVNVNIGLQN